MMSVSLTTIAMLSAWSGHQLDPSAYDRLEAELTRLIAGFQSLSPLDFDIQAHDFASVLEGLADDF